MALREIVHVFVATIVVCVRGLAVIESVSLNELAVLIVCLNV